MSEVIPMNACNLCRHSKGKLQGETACTVKKQPVRIRFARKNNGICSLKGKEYQLIEEATPGAIEIYNMKDAFNH